MNIISFILIIVCLGASVWLCIELGDAFSYAMAAFFGIASLWFGYRIFKKDK